MEKVVVTTKRMSQAIFSLTTAGCDTVEISAVANAVRLEGIGDGDYRVILHVWSKEAEETEAEVGKGERELTEEEIAQLDIGQCPLCEEHGPLYKTASSGLVVNIACDAGHRFWVPVKPFVPEYLGQGLTKEEEDYEAAKADGAAETQEKAEAVETAVEQALEEVKEKEETGESTENK